MSLQDYIVVNDRFEEAQDMGLGMCFPCNECKYRNQPASEEPCRNCGHNCHAGQYPPEPSGRQGGEVKP